MWLKFLNWLKLLFEESMVEPLRSPKDEAENKKPHGKPISDEAEAIDRLRWELKEIFEWLKSHSEFVTKSDLENTERKILMNQAELAAGLKAIQTQVGKVAAEQAAKSDALIAKVAELEAVIAAGGDVTPEVTEALDGVKTAVQALDDVIPDAPPTP